MNSTTSQRAGRREWIGLAVLMLPTLLIAMDISVLHLAVPSLSADLQPSSSQLLWITDIYGFMIAGSLITMGTLGDRIGRRRLLLGGAVAFGIASILAAFSPTAELLIVSRALLGIAGATLMPSTMSLIRNMFYDPHQRTVAIGIWVSGFSVGSSIGPLIGGILLEYFWWGSVFLIGVPVMGVLLFTGPLLLPEYKDPNPDRFDIFSAVLSLLAVLIVIYGLKQIAENGVYPLAIGWVVVGLVIGVVFVYRQHKLTNPLIDLQLFRRPEFSASLATYTLGIFFAFGIFLFIAQYLQLVLGLSPLQAGLWSVPGAIAFVIGSNLAPKIVRHVRPAYVVAGGLLIAAFGFGLLTQVGNNSLALVVIGNSLTSVGFGFTFTLTVDLVLGAAPPTRAGAASALAETGAEFGGALGLAILGSLGTAIYRSQVVTAIPSSLSSDRVESILDTLGSATLVTEQLSDSVGTPLLLSAQEAFAEALRINAGLGLIGFIGLALVVGFILRNAHSHVEADEPLELELAIEPLH